MHLLNACIDWTENAQKVRTLLNWSHNAVQQVQQKDAQYFLPIIHSNMQMVFSTRGSYCAVTVSPENTYRWMKAGDNEVGMVPKSIPEKVGWVKQEVERMPFPLFSQNYGRGCIKPLLRCVEKMERATEGIVNILNWISLLLSTFLWYGKWATQKKADTVSVIDDNWTKVNIHTKKNYTNVCTSLLLSQTSMRVTPVTALKPTQLRKDKRAQWKDNNELHREHCHQATK